MSIIETDKSKGLIRNPRKAGRVIDYAGLNRTDSMSKQSAMASDIDSVIEISNKYLILIEIKERGNNIKMGQHLLLTRLANAWVHAGQHLGVNRKSVVLFATHDPELLDVVPVSECNVEKSWSGGDEQWLSRDINLIEAIQAIGESWNIKKLKKQI